MQAFTLGKLKAQFKNSMKFPKHHYSKISMKQFKNMQPAKSTIYRYWNG